jgi:poly-gamma-glutamate synthesis protein (capsule biosynthesis protein)
VGKVSIIATGDIMAHGAVQQSAAALGGYPALYAEVRPVIESADLAFGNLETPVAPKHDHGARPFVFNAPPAMLEALTAAGFKVVLFANNHCYDQERDGFVETLDSLDAAKLAYVGAGHTRAAAAAPLRFEVNGVRLAWFGGTEFFNDPKNVDDPAQPAANVAETQAMADAIAQVRPHVDAVIVAVHWGVEYQAAPRPQEIEMAHRWLEAGADVIIGSHPHVLEPLEIYATHDGRTGLILYSLGNFISNQSRQYVAHASADAEGDPRDGAFVRFTLEKRDYGRGGTAMNLADLAYVPLWNDNNFHRTEGESLDIRPVVIDAEVQRLRAELAPLEAPGAPASAEVTTHIIAIKRRLDLLLLRRQRIVSRLGEDFAGEPSPELMQKVLAASPPGH